MLFNGYVLLFAFLPVVVLAYYAVPAQRVRDSSMDPSSRATGSIPTSAVIA